MRDPKLIRTALDDCLSGVDSRPSLQGRVLARAQGRRRAPVRLSYAMAIALLIVLLAAAALAAGVLTGLFRLDQQSMVSSIKSCVSDGERLYFATAGGLYQWRPGNAEPDLLSALEPLPQPRLHLLVYLENGAVGLLDTASKSLWQYRDGSLMRTLDYADTPMDQPGLRPSTAVFQDGWLFVHMAASNDPAGESQLWRVDALTGAAEHLPIGDLRELCAYRPGLLLALVASPDGEDELLVAVDTSTGAIVETLFTAPREAVSGVACDPIHHAVYALVNGWLSRLENDGWQPLQSYAPPFLSTGCAVVDGGYASLSYSDLQYLPFAEAETLQTLTIRGYIATDDLDAAFQKDHPGVAVARSAEPAITLQDVRQAILSGDTTDLFHVVLDADTLALFADGLAAPLTASRALTDDAEAMLPAFSDALFYDGQLYAVPSYVSLGVWQGEGDVPADFDSLLRAALAWNEAAPYLSRQWEDGAWSKREYVDLLLTGYLAQGGAAALASPALADALASLRAAQLAPCEGGPEGAAFLTNIPLGLHGDSSVQLQEGDFFAYSPEAALPAPRQTPWWQLAPAAGAETGRPALVDRLHVYLLNPHAAHPEAALAFLEYAAAHRPADIEAMLKPDQAQPTLHPGVAQQIAWIVEDQRAYDAEQGVSTDEAALAQRVDAIRADPGSWLVLEEKLDHYRRYIVPHIRLKLDPLLTQAARREGGAYAALLDAATAYVQGEITWGGLRPLPLRRAGSARLHSAGGGGLPAPSPATRQGGFAFSVLARRGTGWGLRAPTPAPTLFRKE